MTFSVVGRCADTGMTGVAITTSSIAVGSRCPYARAGAGAVTTQNITDPSIGPAVLDLMQSGKTAQDAIAAIMKNRKHADYRQVAAIDSNGMTSSFTGKNILGINAVASGTDCIAAGNLLSVENVPAEMVASFEANHNKHLADRLVTALQAGIDAGGEEGPTHSAALIVAHEHTWPLVDLRVDWSDSCPGMALRSLWNAYEPQMQPYLLRAIDPAAAPSYGVAGDE
ncbi:DUF1028 domain-containing protein [Candidatus Puniceispirillum sp.]|jgi:uncharacterized Ntn-hydrolase superfamily protein|uniref:DUF1028 domain-containing protein n=1 Tax=Candidatus Puniceispirillum sp. TaxID=2026719 RepID=UPI001ED0ED64|nr:DUF1028 domain-containing protein [Candidatus Puniceispirillum sp.]MBT6565510.1 DUF1028 domain-containing protein [Candidatus Puniceispirillum sp.]